MKISDSKTLLGARNIGKEISKKILLANTSSPGLSKQGKKSAVAASSDPLFQEGENVGHFNPDIRYRNSFINNPLNEINYRNELFTFAQNFEVKKAINIMANEIAISDNPLFKYAVYPKINETQVPQDKQQVAIAIQEYLDRIFYPKLWNMLKFSENGLHEKIVEYETTGKIAYEIVFDSVKNPTDIIDMQPLDLATMQKFIKDDNIYYIQRQVVGTNQTRDRILHENQVVVIEYNKFDFGYVSYADQLRIPYNIMKSMQTAKIMWFAVKSQVRMHIKLAFGDVARDEGIQKLTEAKNQYINKYRFEDDGTITFNNQRVHSAYREFYTAETANAGSPEMEEINSQGPDLTEVDSLNFWEKYFWKATNITYDRIDPNSSEGWGFTDATALRKVEVAFGKEVSSHRKQLNQLFLKPILIQLTLKEAEIGVDLELLDLIKIEWNALNEYEELAELEILAKRVEIATNIVSFGEMEDSEGKTRKLVPITWAAKNILKFAPELLESMETERTAEDKMLGFVDVPEEEPIEDEEMPIEEEMPEDDESAEEIAASEDDSF